MLLTKKQLHKIIRESLLISEAAEAGETVQVGDLSVLILGRYDVGAAPFYIVYNPSKKRKLKSDVDMPLSHKEIDNYVKNKAVTWAKSRDGKMWNTKPDRLKTLIDRGQLTMLRDFTKAKAIEPDAASKASFNTDALSWTLLGVGFIADLIPVGGTLVSTGVNLASIGLALKKKNYLGVALGAVSIILPAIGDSIAILGRLVQKGKKLDQKLAEKLVKGLAKVTDTQIKGWLTKNATDLGIKVTKEMEQGTTKALAKFRKSLKSMAA